MMHNDQYDIKNEEESKNNCSDIKNKDERKDREQWQGLATVNIIISSNKLFTNHTTNRLFLDGKKPNANKFFLNVSKAMKYHCW